MSELTSRTVFLDRDGVINRRRLDHVKSWTEFDFMPGALEALARLRRIEARVVVITNQSVVGRGVIGHADLAAIHERMVRTIAISGGSVERVYACPHAPDAGCLCRKPKTELFRLASQELGIELSRSYMVGDSESDLIAARSVGATPVLIAEPASNGHHGCAVAVDLIEAVTLIEAEAFAGVPAC